jgi:thiosulfate dehydrogenase (quinone) large subunit
MSLYQHVDTTPHTQTGSGATAGHGRPASASPSRAAGTAVAMVRYAVGFVFLWAFLDKTFGFGYATPATKAWINGGSPTRGFLSRVEVGPFQGLFHSWAGQSWADWLFMIGLVGVGSAVLLGVGLRIAAASGTLMMLLMWAAEWPLAQHTASGAPSMSTNPLVDYHIIYALALILIAAQPGAGLRNLGERWARTPLVRRRPWLR